MNSHVLSFTPVLFIQIDNVYGLTCRRLNKPVSAASSHFPGVLYIHRKYIYIYIYIYITGQHSTTQHSIIQR